MTRYETRVMNRGNAHGAVSKRSSHAVCSHVCCRRPQCPYKWFHFECVGLKKQPKCAWWCPTCRPQSRGVAAASVPSHVPDVQPTMVSSGRMQSQPPFSTIMGTTRVPEVAHQPMHLVSPLQPMLLVSPLQPAYLQSPYTAMQQLVSPPQPTQLQSPYNTMQPFSPMDSIF